MECRIISCCMWTLSCNMWDLVPWPGIKLGPPALGVWSLSPWTIREFPSQLLMSPMYMLRCFSHVDHDKLWKDLREMGMPDHLTCLLRNLHGVSEKPDQEATVRTLYGTTDWFKVKKGVQQGCLLSPCLFNSICWAYHETCQAGWVTSWNQDMWEKHQQPQIRRWYHSNDREQRGTKEPLDEGEGGEWKSPFKTKYLKKTTKN